MKFTSAASILLSLASNDAHAFVVPSSSSTPTALHASPEDPYATMLDAIASAADAASTAAHTSAQLASSLSPHDGSGNSINIASSIMTPEAISAAQAKLSILESNLATSSDPALMSQAIIDALDASIQAAEHALESTSVLTSNLANFDTVLSNSMAIHASSSAHLIPPETAELAQAKFALLIHNLSGMSMEDAFLTNFVSDIDRKLDSFSGGADVSANTVMMYGTFAFVLAYSQRQAGVQGYKEELRKALEEGEFDINMLAEDVGVAAESTVTVEDKVQLEDPAIAMATIVENEEPMVPQNKREEETQHVEVLVTTASTVIAEEKAQEVVAKKELEEEVVAPTMAAVTKTPQVTKQKKHSFGSLGKLPAKAATATAEKKVAPPEKAPVAATPMPPAEDVPIRTLMEAAVSEDIVEKVEDSTPVVAAAIADVEPTNVAVASVEVSVKKEESKVKVVVQKKKQKKKKVIDNRPAASPLARLLAEELGLDLNLMVGKGSGKNGKILIDDVRKFQAVRKAKESLANNMGGAYFATASA